MIKVEWSAAGVSLGELVLHFSFIPEVGVQFANTSSQKEAGASGRRNLSNSVAHEGNTEEENN